MTYFLDYATLCINKIQKGAPFPKKGDFGITKNYKGITLTSAWTIYFKC